MNKETCKIYLMIYILPPVLKLIYIFLNTLCGLIVIYFD